MVGVAGFATLLSQLHAHVGENSPPDCFLPLRSLLFKSRLTKQKRAAIATLLRMVRETGLEPVRDYHTPLKRARLPIPPLSHSLVVPSRNVAYYIKPFCDCQPLIRNFMKIFGLSIGAQAFDRQPR